MAPAPPAQHEVSDDAQGSDEEFEATVVVVRGSAATAWLLVDTDGTEFELHQHNLMGRKPSQEQAPEGAQLLALSDPDRVLSRTHALIEVIDDRLWITDLDSTNGIDILRAGVAPLECATQQRYDLTDVDKISLGGREVSFRHQ